MIGLFAAVGMADARLEGNSLSFGTVPSVPAEDDEIGIWSEVKLAIIKKYASAYTTILDKTRREKISSLRWHYIDAYAGPGVHLSKTTGDMVEGSPLIALNTTPAFHQYHFIDADPKRAAQLRTLTEVSLVTQWAAQRPSGKFAAPSHFHSA